MTQNVFLPKVSLALHIQGLFEGWKSHAGHRNQQRQVHSWVNLLMTFLSTATHVAPSSTDIQ